MSKGVRQGSQFILRLTSVDVAAAPAPVETACERGIGRLLIVDDNQDCADFMAMLMANYGYEGRTAYGRFYRHQRWALVMAILNLKSFLGYGDYKVAVPHAQILPGRS